MLKEILVKTARFYRQLRYRRNTVSDWLCPRLSVSHRSLNIFSLNHQRGEAMAQAITLVELLIVLAMVGTLAAIGVPAYNNYIDRAKISQAIEDIRFIEAAIEMYRTNEGTLPETLDLVESTNLLDPWDHPYRYLKIQGKTKDELKGKYRHFLSQVPVNLDFDLYSMGEDGKSKPALTAEPSRDDVIRLDGGAYVGTITMY